MNSFQSYDSLNFSNENTTKYAQRGGAAYRNGLSMLFHYWT